MSRARYEPGVPIFLRSAWPPRPTGQSMPAPATFPPSPRPFQHNGDRLLARLEALAAGTTPPIPELTAVLSQSRLQRSRLIVCSTKWV
jgi:hypothetical protein